MPQPDIPAVGQGADLDGVKDYLIMLRRRLNDFLAHLDTLNIDELDANVIIANSITGDKIAAATITAALIAAGTITADKLNVTQLSAITANLGIITAGTIYGAFIATANGTYPRIEFSATDNVLTAWFDANNYVKFLPSIVGGTPAIEFGCISGGTTYTTQLTYFFNNLEYVFQMQTDGDIRQTASGNIYSSPGSGKNHLFSDWTIPKNSTSGKTIQQELDAKANVFTGATGSLTVVTGVDFVAQTTTTKTINYSNGVITSIT